MTTERGAVTRRGHAICRHLPAGSAIVLALIGFAPRAADAACDPAAASNVSATCTGTTLNQAGAAPGTIGAGPAGYGTGFETNLGVTVVQGASVTGTIYGIDAGIVTVTNSGNLSGGGIGISAVAATVTNSGNLSGGDFGVRTTNSASVTNSGNLSGGLVGIVTITGTVSNSGTISGGTSGVSAAAARVTNSGTISGGTWGIRAGTAAVSNSGTITGGVGIQSAVLGSGAADVTNSGRIIGTGGTALFFSGAADALTLLPGSRIRGAIDMGGGADMVNVKPDISWLVTLANFTGTVNGSGNAPFVVVGNQIATLDPTSFAMTDRTLMDFTRGVSSIVGSRVNETAFAGPSFVAAFAPETSAAARVGDAFEAIPGLSAYASDPVFKNPTMVAADGTAVWARGFLGRRTQPGDDPTLKATSSYAGGAMGIDRQFTPAWRLGAFVGGGATKVNVEQNSGTTDSDLIFGGVFGRYGWADSFIDFALHGGGSRNKSTRSIVHNLAADGIENAAARYDGWYVSPELAYGFRYALWPNVTLTPTVRVRYVGASYDGYAETGSSANLTVGSRDIHDIEERFDLALTHARPFLPSAMLITSVHAGVIGLHRLGDTTVNTVLLGANLPFVTPGQDNVAGVVVGGGIEWRSAERISVFVAADYMAMSDSSALVSGKGGLRIAF